MRAALPGLSGTPTTVTLASPMSCATPAMIGCSTGSPFGCVIASLTTSVPVLSENDERTWIGRSKRRAYSTQRRCSTFAPLAASSSISS